jgi:long-chain acyl-CoA synthetase
VVAGEALVSEPADGTPSSLADIALRRARHDPSTPYLLTIDEHEPYDVTTLTYGEVMTRAARLADVLREAGVGRGDVVGCYLTNSPSWVVASLGVWFAGAGVAAVGTLLPAAEADRLFALADVKTVVALLGAPELPDGRTVLEIAADGVLVGDGDPGADAWRDADLVLPPAEDLAVAIFTSGTTGQPKGITHTHSDLINAAHRVAAGYARNADYRPEPAPANLPPGVVFNPFGHMAGISRVSFRMWIGRSSVLVPKFTVPAVRAVFARYEIDSLQITPAMIHMLATTEEQLELSGLKYVTSGTAPLSIATRERFEDRYGVPVMQAYGMSETGAVAQERFDDVVAGRRGPGSVGRIAKGVEIKIRPLDGYRPEGEGELLVRTDELTTEFIGGVKVPLDEEGWFATGDVGRIDDEILYITGRVQEKIIVGGFNVYPAEVEDAARRSPLVRDVVVVGVPDDRLGEIPVAGVVWAGEPDPDALLAAMRSDLAGYKVPRAAFSLDAVPLTPRDKVDRRRTAELAREALGITSPPG